MNMVTLLKRYTHWLHGKWPAGLVEKLPEVGEGGKTNVPGVRIVGDLSGVPLLKFSSDTGARAVQAILEEPDFAAARGGDDGVVDVAIVGGGVSGVSAAMEAKRAGLQYVLFEVSELFSTVGNFPKGKPIYTYPTEMRPAGGIQYGERSVVKEGLLEEMREQVEGAGLEITRARIERIERKGGFLYLHHGGEEGGVTKALRVVVAIGRSGNYRKMGVPGEERDKVSNRLHDPKEYGGKRVLVVGGGDSALETAVALVESGAEVTLSYRGEVLSRPKPENVAAVEALAGDDSGGLYLALGTRPVRVEEEAVVLEEIAGGEEREIGNDHVFSMIGREAPLDFFRRSGIRITGERNVGWWVTAGLMVLFFTWVYHWKGGLIKEGWMAIEPGPVWDWIAGANAWFQAKVADTSSFFYTLKQSASGRSFYYTIIYSILILVFGIRRIRRRRTPYVRLQTYFLMGFQWLAFFLLPEIILPFAGRNGAFDAGVSAWLADQFFPAYDASVPAERAYWRAYGLAFAWPLFVYNWFTSEPMWGWLILGGIQTFVLIPWMVRRWGKGAYCGWICSCGALAETVGDTHRHKMPHGPFWNKLNMIGQVFLGFAVVIMVLRIVSWIWPYSWVGGWSDYLFSEMWGFRYNYFVDLIFAGILGVAFYFHLSGRVWCRFACPLAALMHIYARFGKFRIFAEKKKCISCNVCTSVCHQGIDVMNFANKGMAMEDPECVRCSACVQQCPTGVLSFGRLEEGGRVVLDKLEASPVQMREKERAGLER